MPNGLSTVADFDGDGRSDVMGVLPWGARADTWVVSRSEGSAWFDVVADGSVDPVRARSVAWPPGPKRMPPLPMYFFFKKEDGCEPDFLDFPWWELPPAGSTFTGDFDGNGLPDIAYAFPWAPTPPSTTVPWEMFLSSGSGWIGSPRDRPASGRASMRWPSGPVADIQIHCDFPRRFSLGLYCRVGRFDPDERDDIACYDERRRLWQVGHASDGDWSVEEVDAGPFAAESTDAPDWVEDCFAADLDGDGIDELACPAGSGTALGVLRRGSDGGWRTETWPVESLPPGLTLNGCFRARLSEDALDDIACATSQRGQWLLALSDGQRFRAATVSPGFATADPHEQCFTSDIDTDGRSDLVCLEKAPNRFLVAFARGLALAPAEALRPPLPRSISPAPGWCRLGDFDGDTAVEVACVASDMGSSIVTRAAVPVPDELTAYTTPFGATVRFTFGPAADQPLSPPVLRRRYLEAVDVDPGAEQPALRTKFSYGGPFLGDRRNPAMTFSTLAETDLEVRAEGVETLRSRVDEYSAWELDGGDGTMVLVSSRNLDAAGCPLASREMEYRDLLPRKLPRLVSTRELLAGRRADEACPALVEVLRRSVEYDDQARPSCTSTHWADAAGGQWSCVTYEPGEALPLRVSDRPPRVTRTSLFSPCLAVGGEAPTVPAWDCQSGEAYPELAGSASAPDAVRALARRRFDYAVSLPPCGPPAETPPWSPDPLAVHLVDHLGGERGERQVRLDGHGNIACSGTPGGPYATAEWHHLGHVSTRTCELGGTACWQLEHSGSGSPLDGDAPGGLLTRATAPWGSIRRFVFDPLGRPTAVEDGDRGVTRYERLDLGDTGRQRLRVRLPAGDEIEERLDGLGRAVATTHRPLLGDPTSIERRFDGLGRVAAVSAPHSPSSPSLWQRFRYDALGRLVELVHPDGSSEEYSHLPGGLIHRDALGVETRLARRRLDGGEVELRIERPSGADTLVAAQVLDGLGRTTSVGDSSGPLAAWTFDTLGDLRQRWERSLGTTLYSYDDAGRRTAVESPDGSTRHYRYDAHGRPIRSRIGRWPRRDVERYAYDDSSTGLGRLARLTDGATDFRWSYGAAARLEAVRFRNWGMGGRMDVAVEYSFDDRARLARVRLPDGRTLRAEYRGDRLHALHDAAADLTLVRYLAYDPNGLPSLTELADGTSVERRYDRRGRLEGLVLGDRVTSLAYGFSYTAVGDLSEVEVDGSSLLEASYDDLGRITKLRAADGVERRFLYDELSNLSAVSGGPELLYGEGGDHPHALSEVDGKSLNNDESMRARVYGGADIRYRRDFPRAISHGRAFWRTEKPRFDPLGRPFALRTTGGTEQRAFGLWRKLGRSCHVAIPSLHGVIALSPCGEAAYEFVHPGPGSTIVATSRRVDGELQLDEVLLDPWAPLPRRELEGLLRPTTFTLRGGELQLQGRRLLATRLGRFLQPDPVYPPDSSLQEINRYAFARANPLRYADPLGLQTIELSMSYGWGGSLATGVGGFTPMFNPGAPAFGLGTALTIEVGFDAGGGRWADNMGTSAAAAPSSPRPLLSYQGDALLDIDVSFDLSVGSSFGIGPTFSSDGSVSQSVGFGPFSTELSSDGTVSWALSAGPTIQAGSLRLSLLEAGPVLVYSPRTDRFSAGLQVRGLGVTLQGTASAQPGLGLIRLYQEIERALNPYRCGMSCAWFAH